MLPVLADGELKICGELPQSSLGVWNWTQNPSSVPSNQLKFKSLCFTGHGVAFGARALLRAGVTRALVEESIQKSVTDRKIVTIPAAAEELRLKKNSRVQECCGIKKVSQVACFRRVYRGGVRSPQSNLSCRTTGHNQ